MSTTFIEISLDGYEIQPHINYVTIEPDGYIYGPGLSAKGHYGYTIVNYGKINAGSGFSGIYIYGATTITNKGGLTHPPGRIEGDTGITQEDGVGGLTNVGVIVGNGVGGGLLGGDGVADYGGFSVTNGTPIVTTPMIYGTHDGVYSSGASGPSAVTNFASIIGATGVGVYDGGGTVINGSATDRSALIEGYVGVDIGANPGNVTNFATIKGVARREAMACKSRPGAPSPTAR